MREERGDGGRRKARAGVGCNVRTTGWQDSGAARAAAIPPHTPLAGNSKLGTNGNPRPPAGEWAYLSLAQILPDLHFTCGLRSLLGTNGAEQSAPVAASGGEVNYLCEAKIRPQPG